MGLIDFFVTAKIEGMKRQKNDINLYPVPQFVRKIVAGADGYYDFINTSNKIWLVTNASVYNNTVAAQGVAALCKGTVFNPNLYASGARDAAGLVSQEADCLKYWDKPVILPPNHMIRLEDYAGAAGHLCVFSIMYYILD